MGTVSLWFIDSLAQQQPFLTGVELKRVVSIRGFQAVRSGRSEILRELKGTGAGVLKTAGKSL